MTALASRFSSPRFQRRLFWAGGVLLVVGIVVVVAVLVWTGPRAKPVSSENATALRPAKEKTVPIDPAAKAVGERFIETAVERKNLAESWSLVAPALKGNFTLARWKTGNIPVVPYPADTSQAARAKVEYSHKDSVLFLILLLPHAGDKTKPQLFHLGLHAFGQGASRHWLVDYWAPYGVPKIPLG